MTEYVVPIDVRFADLDALGHLNSTKSFVYAEHARVNWLIENGFATGPAALPIIIAAAHAEYHKTAAHGTPLEVAMSLTKLGTKSWEWHYLIRERGGTTAYTTVTTTQVAFDYANRASIAIPPHLRTALETLRPNLNPPAP